MVSLASVKLTENQPVQGYSSIRALALVTYEVLGSIPNTTDPKFLKVVFTSFVFFLVCVYLNFILFCFGFELKYYFIQITYPMSFFLT